MAWLGIYSMEERTFLALSLQNVMPKNTANQKQKEKKGSGNRDKIN